MAVTLSPLKSLISLLVIHPLTCWFLQPFNGKTSALVRAKGDELEAEVCWSSPVLMDPTVQQQ